MRFECAVAVSSVLCSGLALAPARDLRAQHWDVVNALGYASGGVALAFLATRGEECTGFLCLPPRQTLSVVGGFIGGAIIGGGIGSLADDRVSSGRGLGPGLLASVVVGTLATGAAAGLLGGWALRGTGDEAVSAAVGALFAIAYLQGRWGSLTGSALEVGPSRWAGGLSVGIRVPL